MHHLRTKIAVFLMQNSNSSSNVVFTKHIPVIIGIRSYGSKKDSNNRIELDKWCKSLNSNDQRKLRYIQNEVMMKFSKFLVKASIHPIQKCRI